MIAQFTSTPGGEGAHAAATLHFNLWLNVVVLVVGCGIAGVLPGCDALTYPIWDMGLGT